MLVKSHGLQENYSDHACDVDVIPRCMSNAVLYLACSWGLPNVARVRCSVNEGELCSAVYLAI